MCVAPARQPDSLIAWGRDDPTMAHLILVRHGQIAANLTQHWHGSTDSPLTPHGEREVELVANYLSASGRTVSAIYASPLQRTRDTGQGIAAALRLPLALDPALREYGIGELEGTHYKDLQEQQFFMRVAADHEYAPAGGESIAAVARRVAAALQRISDAHRGKEVVVVSHGAALGIALGHLLHGDPLKWREYSIRNCSITELKLRPAPRLLRLNHVAHLHA